MTSDSQVRVGRMSVAEIRQEFRVADYCTYLNTAALGLMPRSGIKAMVEWEEQRTDRYLDSDYERWLQLTNRVREKMATLIGASTDEIAFTTSTTDGLAIAANGLLRPGDHVVATNLGHSADYSVWFNPVRQGISVSVVKDRDGAVLPEDIAEAIRPNTRIVFVCAVVSHNGYRVDLEAMSEICRKRRVHLVVDAVQAVGALNIDVSKLDVAVLAAGAYKWLCSSHGLGFVYVNRNLIEAIVPVHVWFKHVQPTPYGEWRGLMRDLVTGEYPLDTSRVSLSYDTGARRFEGSLNYAAVFGLEKALDLFLNLGTANVERRLLQVTDLLVELATKIGVEPLSPLNPRNRSSIVTLKVSGAEECARYLGERNVFAPSRLVGRGVRISPHIYNNESDIVRAMDALESFLKKRG